MSIDIERNEAFSSGFDIKDALMNLEPDSRVRWILFANIHSASLSCGAGWSPEACWKLACKGLDWLRDQNLHPNVWDAAFDRNWFGTPAEQLFNLWFSRLIDWIEGLSSVDGSGGSSEIGYPPTAHELSSVLASKVDPNALEVYRKRTIDGLTYEQISSNLGVTTDEARRLFDQVVSLAVQIYHGEHKVTPCLESSGLERLLEPSPPPVEMVDGLFRKFKDEIEERIGRGEDARTIGKDLRVPFDGDDGEEALTEGLKSVFAL